MQFTKLRLTGFKSFVEPMEFVIEHGLNGVVGPNGCGKSNLVEALRWVMGENSYKNMRASGMEDVIFSGSNTRPARNWAEVSLYLTNDDPLVLTQFSDADELQVSRRIERDKGSTYRINGREVRARDVQLLFADRSTGARSPSMVGQGRIGELIAAKPQARRALLEEAAGISGLHGRRHEAELRLRAAQANLERLDDVTGELASRIESLKRQVRQANRFKSLSHEIRKNEAALFYVRWVEAKSLEATIISELNQATLAVVEQAQIQAEAARIQEQAREALPALRDGAAKAGARHQHLQLTLKSLEAKQNREVERRNEWMRILEQTNRDIKREQDLMSENDVMLERLVEEEVGLKEASQDLIIAQEEAQASLIEEENKLHQAERDVQILTDRRAEVHAIFEQNRRQLEILTIKTRQCEEEITASQTAFAALALEMAAFDEIELLRFSCQEMTEKLLAWEEEITHLDDMCIQMREESQRAQSGLTQIELQLSGLQAEERTFEKLLSERGGDGDTLMDNIEVEKGFERALGSALGDDLMASLDEGTPLFWQDLHFVEADPALPSEATPLTNHIKAPPALRRRLAQIGMIASDRTQAEVAKWQQNLKTGQILVNEQGALWRWDGLTMRPDALSVSAQRLTQKNHLQDVKNEIALLMDKKERAEREVKQAGVNLFEAETALRTRREDIKTQRQIGDKQRAKLENLEKMQLAAIARHRHLEEVKERLAREYEILRQQRQEAQDLLAHAPDLTELVRELENANALLRQYRLEWQQIKARVQSTSQIQAQNLRRLETLALERKNWVSRMDNARAQMRDLQIRREEMQTALEEQAAECQDFAARRQSLLDSITEAEITRQQQADILAEAEAAQSLLDASAIQAIERLSARREMRARCEERLNAALDKCRDIERQIADTLQQEPSELVRLAQLSLDSKLPEISVLEQVLERCRIERERLGAVNLRAQEEAEEMDTRYRAMTAERDDVGQAVQKLRQAIHNLNQEGRERLLAAFDVVNEQFQRLFIHLFGGGTAQLQLIESQDPLEAGLEILARPPGKKPQTMTLLSGGEQALTAIALIFAVFLTNPAPICVLDEVDAPLDDHNVERYCNLLDEMARLTHTRFIIITHNPITMARMSRLFGVTMGEQGVSQLVSVDLAKARQIRETSLL